MVLLTDGIEGNASCSLRFRHDVRTFLNERSTFVLILSLANLFVPAIPTDLTASRPQEFDVQRNAIEKQRSATGLNLTKATNKLTKCSSLSRTLREPKY